MRIVLLVALVIGFGWCARAEPPVAHRFFVAPDGRDTNRGDRNHPFASLTRARDAIRSLRRSGKIRGGVSIELRAGDYVLREPVTFTAEDSGTATAHLWIGAYRNETVRLLGGRKVRGWKPVSDAPTRNRLPEVSRDKVLVADLRAQGITGMGALTRRGFVGATDPAPMELFVGGEPMTLARWPNQGEWARIAGIPDGPKGARFNVDSERLSRWTHAEDLWVHGYWTWDWADSYEKVAALDPASRTITTRPPHGVYGYKAGSRFYALNLIEELDAPGEYWIDRGTGRIYLWPVGGKPPADAVVSENPGPLVSVNGAAHVRLESLVLQAGRGNGVEIQDATDVRVRGCRIKNLGRYGVTIRGGARCAVQSCDIVAVGEGGVVLSGGDRQTLTPAGHVADNNHIHHYSRLCKTYTPAIKVEGVGNRISHNRIHDAPHNAIQGGGNDHVIEFNEVFRVCTETGDAGAFYMGRDLTQRGNRILSNYFHHLGASVAGRDGFTDVMAVYLDDCFCGTTIEGNIFFKAGRAAMIGGGRDNSIVNNLFIDCAPAVHVDSRGTGWASFWFDGRDPFLMNGLKAVPYDRAPYTKYPGLANILADDPARAKGNRIERNIAIGGRWLDLLDGLDDTKVTFVDNWTTADPGFVDLRKGDLRLRPDAAAGAIGWKPIPFSKIGLVRDAWRKQVPSQSPLE